MEIIIKPGNASQSRGKINIFTFRNLKSLNKNRNTSIVLSSRVRVMGGSTRTTFPEIFQYLTDAPVVQISLHNQRTSTCRHVKLSRPNAKSYHNLGFAELWQGNYYLYMFRMAGKFAGFLKIISNNTLPDIRNVHDNAAPSPETNFIL
jgi:hypothetical protein